MIKLKSKNREYLENWLQEQMFEWLDDRDYRLCIIDDGFKGINNYSDAELVEEYKQAVRY